MAELKCPGCNTEYLDQKGFQICRECKGFYIDKNDYIIRAGAIDPIAMEKYAEKNYKDCNFSEENEEMEEALVSTHSNYWDILEDCVEIAQERGDSYGKAIENYEDISNICKVLFDIELSPEELAKVMIATKFSRNKTKYKEDNFVDGINYLAMALHFKRLEDKEIESRISKD